MQKSLFNKIAGPSAYNFNKKRLQYRYFPVKFVKLLRSPFYRTPPVAASQGWSRNSATTKKERFVILTKRWKPLLSQKALLTCGRHLGFTSENFRIVELYVRTCKAARHCMKLEISLSPPQGRLLKRLYSEFPNTFVTTRDSKIFPVQK